MIIRNNYASYNVAGLEIENSSFVEAYGNTAEFNTAGLLIFNLPDLSQLGRNIKVYHNTLRQNNIPNFAHRSNIVAEVQAGIGLMILSVQNVEIYKNKFENNSTSSILIVNYQTTSRPVNDPSYDSHNKNIKIYQNTYLNSGFYPQKGASKNSKVIMKWLRKNLSTPFPDIIFDGVLESNLPQKTLCLDQRENFSFVNLHLESDNPSKNFLFTPDKYFCSF